MVRAAAAVLLLAVVALVATSVAWLRAAAPTEAMTASAAIDVRAFVAEIGRRDPGAPTIDLAKRYEGRLDLIDPRAALPSWHKHPRTESVRVYSALKTCPPPALAPSELSDPVLVKAHAWHASTCAGTSAPAAADVERPPFLHPSGRSYAALALSLRGSAAPAEGFARAHVRSFHVLELAGLPSSDLDAEDRMLGALGLRAWEAITRGDRVAVTPTSFVVVEPGPLGVARLRIHERSLVDDVARASGVALAPRGRGEVCSRPAAPDLCLRAIPPAERQRRGLLLATTASGGIAALASLALALAYIRERRRVHADRIHVLRTLTHELRTPATSLRLDIEPLRAEYDRLPESCQEPLLRISEDIERLHRVLHRSAKYMALFESSSSSKHSLVAVADVPSVKEMLEDFAEEWPEGVILEAASADGAARTDVDWLSVALRNLVENACRHGRPPVAVGWRIVDSDLVVRVSDGGETPKLSLRRAVAPHERDPNSPGLGLGLAIVERIARLLGGSLVHEASPTVFELRIPIS